MLLAFAVTTLASAYSLVMAESTEIVHDQNARHAQDNMDWPGIYQGFMPCADCAGVKTTLAFNKNNSYVLMTQFIGKSDREFVEKGKFTWDNNSKTITLTPRKSATTQQYIVEENSLIQLDPNGKRFTGKYAEHYVLRRKDVANEPQPHSGH
ncbi:MAG: copper resistance protein NlpE [Methylococcaceae bacterium]|nr:copper resistance protein NlpE [Methylococcaceae bacterium]